MKIKTKVYLVKDFENLDTKERTLVKAATKDSKQQIHKGTKGIMKKVKKMGQNFSKAIIKGSKSGNGKLIFEFYEKLQRYGVDLLMFQS